MRVALVHDWLTGMRGGEKCLEVFCELFPEADLYTLLYLPEHVSPTIRSMKVHSSWFNRVPGATQYYRYALPLFPTLIENFAPRNYDLILSSSHCVAKGIVPAGALHISYVHSPMRYVWDMHGAYFGSTTPWPVRAGMSLCRGYLQRWDVRSAKRVDFFVANSRNIAGKIRSLYNRDAVVIYPPVDIEKFYISSVQESFYLIVSALVPYKNIEISIKAFNQLGLPLKIAGEGPRREALEKLAGPSIEFLGWVDEGDLARLCASCQALVFPGEEDFGIVPLEAQASGRPVIAYQKGGVTESVAGIGDGQQRPTGVFFAESTSESLIKAVERYVESKDLFEPERLRDHAAQFSRPTFKSKIKDFIDQTFSERLERR